MPPVPLPPKVASAPFPVMVKLPVVFVITMPLVPPLAETRVSEILRGVLPPARVISTAAALLVVMLPLVAIIVWVLLVASKPRCDASGVIVREPKVIAPVFVVRLIPVAPELVTDVFAKSSAALEVFTVMPMPVGLLIVVKPLVNPPPTLVRLIPVAPFVEEMLPKDAAGVRFPVVRFSAWPLPFRVTSEMARLPKPVPLMSGAALPPVNPRRVLLEPTLMPAEALVILTIGAPGLVAGKGSLPAGGTTPEIEERVAAASCPMNFCPARSVTGPT